MRFLFSAFLVFVLLCSTISNAESKDINFRNIFPSIALEPERKFSFSFPIVPYGGFRNVASMENIPNFFKVLRGIDFFYSSSSNYLTSLNNLIIDINNLYRNRFTISTLSYPQLSIKYKSRLFEFTFNGIFSSFTKSEVFVFQNNFDFFNIKYYWNGVPYLITDQQEVLRVKTLVLLGSEVWGTVKIPVKIPKYRLNLLLGIGGTLGALHKRDYRIRVAEELSEFNTFSDYTKSGWSFVGDFGLRFGVELKGFKYLYTRVVLEAEGLARFDSIKLPQANLGVFLGIYNICKISMDILDMGNPSVKLSVGRDFGSKTGVSVGGITNYKLIGNKDLGYISWFLRSKYMKLTTTFLFEKSRVGFLVGVSVGYYP